MRIRFPGGQTTGAALGRAEQDRSTVRQRRSPAHLARKRAAARIARPRARHAHYSRCRKRGSCHPRVTSGCEISSPPRSVEISGGLGELYGRWWPTWTRAYGGRTSGSRTCPPGSFSLFDDGRGDVSGRSFDLGFRAVDHDHGWLLLGAADLGISVPASHAADMLLALAREFLAASRRSGDVWHVRELRSWTRSVPGVRTINLPLERTDIPLGAVGGAASVQGTTRLVDTGTSCHDRGLCCGAGRGSHHREGLCCREPQVDCPSWSPQASSTIASSPWSAISACVGAPSCHKSLIDTRAYATRMAECGHALPRTHVSGCERRCGAPSELNMILSRRTAESPLLLAGGPVITPPTPRYAYVANPA